MSKGIILFGAIFMIFSSLALFTACALSSKLTREEEQKGKS